LYGVCVWSKVPAGVVLVFGWVEKSLFTALSIAGCSHACKMFTYYSKYLHVTHLVLQYLLKVMFNIKANYTLTSHIL